MSTYYTGVNNLLAPENCTLILIDHQPLQFAGVQNIDETLLVNNVVGLAKTAKVFSVPTILTTIAGIGEIMSKHGGSIGPSLAWEFQLLGANSQKPGA